MDALSSDQRQKILLQSVTIDRGRLAPPPFPVAVIVRSHL